METTVGIDLGTTNSVISVMEGDKVTVINNAQGHITTPSVVGFTETEVLIGHRAKNQAVTNPTNTVNSIKRFMGLTIKEVKEAAKLVPYQLAGSNSDPVKVKVLKDQVFTPQEISAKILKELKQSAEAYLGKPVTDAVITVPAYFNDAQRQATKDAGVIAGFNVKRIINEPTAAALAFGFKEDTTKESRIAVFDLGGGTFDISVLEIGGGVLEVKSTNGDTFLGGDDFDAEILNHVAEDFLKHNGIDLRKDPVTNQRLREASEKAKCELSNSLVTNLNLPFIAIKEGQPVHFKYDLTRAKFESLIKDHLKKAEKCCKQALQDANLSPEALDHVILVGGSTRIPLVQELVRKLFKKEPNRSVNPDEVVSRGAAIQGAILQGGATKMVLLDVTPLSLGIETVGEEMDILIPRNTTIPFSIKEIYTTADDDQDEVEVYVYQGERRLVKNNRLLGNFKLEGIHPGPAGEPQIEVSFDIDANGILKVSAKDLATGRSQKIVLQNSSSLTPEEISRMQQGIQDDTRLQEENQQLHQLFNKADTILQQTQQGVVDFADKLSVTDVEELEKCTQNIQESRAKKDVSSLNQNLDQLMEKWAAILSK